MSPDWKQKTVILLAALVAAGSWLAAGNRVATAGHPYGFANCNTAPASIKNCIYIYSAEGYNLIQAQKSFAVHNYRYSNVWTTAYETALDQAERNWAIAAGPQAPM